jgi:magnesium-transporting ATPase (P-type)
VDEVPFDTDRKRLSTLHQTAQGRVLYTKGAMETVLPLCSRIQIGAELLPLDEQLRTKLAAAQEALAEKGLRVLAFAQRQVAADCPHDELELDMTMLGLVGLEDPPRP